MQKCFPVSFLATMLTGLMILSSCSGSKHPKKRLAGVWQSTPIVVDGNGKDWPSPYPEYDSKAMLGYAVSNDKDNLYITVETGDQATQLKILHEGLTVWIDKNGGNEKTMAINYPLPDDYKSNKTKSAKDEERKGLPGGGVEQGSGAEHRLRGMLAEKIKKALDDAKEFSLQGFKSCNTQFPVLEKDSCGIVVSINIDEFNELVWEATIPFKSFYYKAGIDARDKGKPISVCFETTGQKRPASQSGGSHKGGGGGGGMRPSMSMGGRGMGMSMGGGGMRGGGGGNQTSNPTTNPLEPLYITTATWKKIGLAWQGQ